MVDINDKWKKGMGQKPTGGIPIPQPDKKYSVGDEPGGRIPISGDPSGRPMPEGNLAEPVPREPNQDFKKGVGQKTIGGMPRPFIKVVKSGGLGVPESKIGGIIVSEKRENFKKGMGQKPTGGIPIPQPDKKYSVGDEPGGRIPIPELPEPKKEEEEEEEGEK